jgi:hypothetical protein
MDREFTEKNYRELAENGVSRRAYREKALQRVHREQGFTESLQRMGFTESSQRISPYRE